MSGHRLSVLLLLAALAAPALAQSGVIRVELRSVETGAPIANSRVAWWDRYRTKRLESDGHGVVAVPPGSRFARLRADGYETIWCPSRSTTRRVAPAFSIDVQAHGARDGSLTCLPLARVGIPTRSPHAGQGRFSVRGVATLRGLPTGMPLVVGVTGPLGSRHRLVLCEDAPTRRRLTFDLADCGAVEGRVDGLAGTLEERWIRVALEWHRGGVATTLEHAPVRGGRFRFARVTSGRYVVRVEQRFAHSIARSVPLPVTVTRGATARVVLDGRVAPLRPIEGRTLDAAGLAQSVWVCFPKGHGWQRVVKSGLDGRFRTPPLVVQPHELFAIEGGYAVATPGEAATLRARPGCRFRIVVGDCTLARGERIDGTIVDARGRSRGLWSSDRHGVIEQRLSIGRYTIRVVHRGRVGIARDVTLSSATGPDVAIRLEAAGRLVLRPCLDRPQSVAIARPGDRVPTTVCHLVAHPRTVHLPPGQWVVRTQDGRELARATVRIGEDTPLRIEP